MSDPLKPDTSLLCKLGSIARHIEEATGPGAHRLDVDATVALVNEPDVQAWMAEMDKLAMLPVRR